MKLKLIVSLLLFVCGLIANALKSDRTTYLATAQAQSLTTIEDLADGNYRYCSDRNPYPGEDKPDGHRWCFDFLKMGTQIIGS